MINLDLIGSKNELHYVKVTENVIVATMYPYEMDKFVRLFETANMGCVALPEELVFIDCGSRTDLATQFREDMEAHFERKTSHLLLTHSHWDHSFGMNAFKDVETVISSAGRSYIRRNIKNGVFDRYIREIQEDYIDNEKLCQSVRNLTLFTPTTGVSKEKVFGSSSDVLIFTVTGGHTKPSATIYYPSQKVLFTGDNLVSCYFPAVWRITIVDLYNNWLDLDIDYFVPGHGPTVNKDYVKRIRDYLDELLTFFRELRDQGLKSKEALKHPDLPEYPGKNQQSWIKGSKYHSKRLRIFLNSYYDQILKETINDEVTFIIN
ncbi:MAG: MBL fold metallo-hydrolase [Candidatus Hermodarchaeota archaeon]